MSKGLTFYHRLPPYLQSGLVTAKGIGIARSRYSRRFRRAFDQMRAGQWRSTEDWEVFQLERLAELIRLARENVPYYRTRLPEVVPDSNLVSVLSGLPLLPKSVVRHHSDELYSLERDKRGTEHRTTSGTTGTPLKIVSSAEASVMIWAAMARFWSWAGVGYGDRRLSFTGNQIVSPDRTQGPYGLLDRANNRLMMSVYHLKPDTIDEYLDTIEDFRPAFIDGYPSAMAIIARRAIEQGRHIGVTAAFPTAETLTPDVRRVIEDGFQTRVYNQYGSQEWSALITECPAGRLHVNPEIGVVEILNADGSRTMPGEMGELVVTGLVNRLMPFIRYRIGDIARAEAPDVICECGRQMPLIAEIIGRQDDVVETPDGRRVGMLAYNVFKHGNHIKEAQIVQEEIDHFVLNIVPDEGFNELVSNRLAAELRRIVGDNVVVDVEICDSLRRGANGKLRSVISKIV